MKDCFLDTLFSPGEACVDGEETLTRPCIYIKTFFPLCQVPGLYHIKLISFFKKITL